jgi:hypothetical protein
MLLNFVLFESNTFRGPGGHKKLRTGRLKKRSSKYSSMSAAACERGQDQRESRLMYQGYYCEPILIHVTKRLERNNLLLSLKGLLLAAAESQNTYSAKRSGKTYYSSSPSEMEASWYC